MNRNENCFQTILPAFEQVLSTSIPIYLSIHHLYIYISIYTSICLSVCLSLSQTIAVSLSLSFSCSRLNKSMFEWAVIYLSVCLSACPSVPVNLSLSFSCSRLNKLMFVCAAWSGIHQRGYCLWRTHALYDLAQYVIQRYPHFSGDSLMKHGFI